MIARVLMKPSFHSFVLAFHIWINCFHLVSKAKAHKIGLSYFQQTTDWFIRLWQQIKSLAVFKVCYSFWWNKSWKKSEGKQGACGAARLRFMALRPPSSHLDYSWHITFPSRLFLLRFLYEKFLYLFTLWFTIKGFRGFRPEVFCWQIIFYFKNLTWVLE